MGFDFNVQYFVKKGNENKTTSRLIEIDLRCDV